MVAALAGAFGFAVGLFLVFGVVPVSTFCGAGSLDFGGLVAFFAFLAGSVLPGDSSASFASAGFGCFAAAAAARSAFLCFRFAFLASRAAFLAAFSLAFCLTTSGLSVACATSTGWTGSMPAAKD